MKRASGGLALALLFTFATACSDARVGTAGNADLPVSSVAASAASDAPAATSDAGLAPALALQRAVRARPEHFLRVREAHGPPANPPLEVGAELAPDGVWSIARGASVVLAVDDYAQLRVVGPARFVALPEGQPALLVHEGVVSVDCAPRAAHTTDSAFWLADSNVRLDVVASARFVLGSARGHASELALVSGNVDLAPAGQPLESPLAPETRCIGAAGVSPRRAGHGELARAERALSARASCAKLSRARVALAQTLGAHLDELERGREREQALLREHAERVRAGRADAADLRSELAQLSSALLRQRGQARALRAIWEAATLASAHGEGERALRERARELAPYRE